MGRVYTRLEFARLVGISSWTLKKWHNDGYFVARVAGAKGRGQACLYTEEQVAELRKLPKRYDPAHFKHDRLYTADDAQRCFGAFDEGRPARYCVSKLGVHPDAVVIIQERYALLGQGFLLPPDIVARVNECTNLDGIPIRSPDDIAHVVKAANAQIEELEDKIEGMKPAVCGNCEAARSSFCGDCVARTLKAHYELGFADGYAKARAETPAGAPAPAETPAGDTKSGSEKP